MDWRQVIVPAVRNVLARHATTGAGVGVVLEGDRLETQAAGVAALLVAVGFAVADEIKKRRRLKKASDIPSTSPKG